MVTKDPVIEALGQRIALARKRIGTGTQKDAAAALGISEGHLRKLESGRGGSPSVDILLRLATASGESLSWLAVGERDEPLRRTNGELLGRLLAALAAVYRTEGVSLSELELGRLAALEHDAAIATTPDQWSALIPVIAERHRLQLRTEPMGRHEASG